MPYSIVQFPDGYRVMTDDTGEFHSIKALPLARAEKQYTALNIALAREHGHDIPARGGAMTYRQKFLAHYSVPDKSYSIPEIAHITHIPEPILQEVYNRGVGAYKTNPTSVRLQTSFVKNVDAPMKYKLSKEQWGMARVFSFVMGNPKHDNDLRRNRGGAVDLYMKAVLQKAKQEGYDDPIDYADDGVHKLQITTPDGRVVRFGRKGYGDFIIWTAKEKSGEVPKGYAEQKRRVFHASHSKIKGNWKADPYSPNNLALRILW